MENFILIKPHTKKVNVNPNRKFKFTIQGGGTGDYSYGAAISTTVEIYSDNAGIEMTFPTSSSWNIKTTHTYHSVDDFRANSIQTLTLVEENVAGKTIENIFDAIDELDLKKHNGNYILTTVPEIYLSKWYIEGDDDIKICGSLGEKKEIIENVKEIIGFDERELEMLKLVYYRFKDVELQEEYGQIYKINQKNSKTRRK